MNKKIVCIFIMVLRAIKYSHFYGQWLTKVLDDDDDDDDDGNSLTDEPSGRSANLRECQGNRTKQGPSLAKWVHGCPLGP